MGIAGCWHARRVKAGALRRRGGVSGPAVHYACPCGGGRGPRAGGIAHARQPAGCTVVPQGLPFGGAPAGGGGRASWLGGLGGLGGGDGERGPDGSCSRGRLTSRRQNANWPVGKWYRASRGGRVDQLAHGWKSTTGSTDQGSRIWRSHPNRRQRYICRNVLLGRHDNGHRHGQIYMSRYMSDKMMGWMDIYISTYIGPETYCRVDEREGSLGAWLPLQDPPSALKARVHHPNQTVPRAGPTPGTNGEESTLNPPVDT